MDSTIKFRNRDSLERYTKFLPLYSDIEDNIVS